MNVGCWWLVVAFLVFTAIGDVTATGEDGRRSLRTPWLTQRPLKTTWLTQRPLRINLGARPLRTTTFDARPLRIATVGMDELKDVEDNEDGANIYFGASKRRLRLWQTVHNPILNKIVSKIREEAKRYGGAFGRGMYKGIKNAPHRDILRNSGKAALQRAKKGALKGALSGAPGGPLFAAGQALKQGASEGSKTFLAMTAKEYGKEGFRGGVREWGNFDMDELMDMMEDEDMRNYRDGANVYFEAPKRRLRRKRPKKNREKQTAPMENEWSELSEQQKEWFKQQFEQGGEQNFFHGNAISYRNPELCSTISIPILCQYDRDYI